MTADHIIEKIREAYAKVAEWPEERMSAGAIEDLGPGFLDLLALRNLVPALLSRAEAAEAERDALRKALAPFIRHYEPWMDKWPDDAETSTFSRHTFGDLRRARTLAGDNHE